MYPLFYQRQITIRFFGDLFYIRFAMNTVWFNRSMLYLNLLLAQCGSDRTSKNGREPAEFYNSSSAIVWVCVARTSKKYHTNRDCKGLRNCRHRLIEISVREAEEHYSRRPCKLCY